MNHKQLICDPARIVRFLEEELSDEERAEFELHLDDCGECQRSLEAAAAEDEIWTRIRDSLRGQPQPSGGSPAGHAAVESSTDSSSVAEASIQQQAVLNVLAPTDDERMLGRLGVYEIVGVIGSGGMGVVLKAFDAALNRYVAVKVLSPHLSGNGAGRKRFSREAKAAAAVVHENVIEIHGVAETAGLSYLVMPYVPGPSLQRRLDDEGPLTLVEILRIGMQAAAGLAAAHAQGLVHRDVKPANILLADGLQRVKLTDFGLARAADDASLTKTGVIAGTPQYMSPEQARGESVDPRSDLFSLGNVLYAMCTGRAPFRAETSYGVLRRITDEQPRPIRELNPDIPEWFGRLICRLMAKRPDERYTSARKVAELLEACLAHVQQPTTVSLPTELVPTATNDHTFFSRRTAAIAAAGCLGLVLLPAVWQFVGPRRGTEGDAGRSTPPVRGNAQKDEGETQVAVANVDAQNEAPSTDFENILGRWEVVSVEGSGGRFMTLSDQSRPGDRLLIAHVESPNGRRRWWLSEELRRGWSRDDSLHLHPDTDPSRLTYKAQEGEESHFHDADHPPDFGIYQLTGDTLTILAGNPREIRVRQGTDTVPTEYRSAKETISNGPPAQWKWKLAVPPYAPMFRREEGRRQILVTLRRIADEDESQPKSASAAPKRIRRFATDERVNTITCSADGKLIAVANGNPTRILQTSGTSRVKDDWKPSVEILDATSGKTVVALNLVSDEEDAIVAATARVSHVEAMALDFSCDGAMLAVGTNIGQVKLFDAQSGKLVRSLDDKPARLADKETPESWQPLKRALGSVQSVVFSPDGSQLALCGRSFGDFSDVFDGVGRLGERGTGGGRLKVYEVMTGALRHDLVGHSYVFAVAFSPDGAKLASAGNWTSDRDVGTGVIVWNPQSGEKLRTLTTFANGGTHAVAFSPNSKMLAIGSRTFDKDADTSTTTIGFAHASTGIQEWTRTVSGWANPKAFSPDGRNVVVQCGGQSFRFFDVDSGTMTHEIKPADASRGGRWNDFSLATKARLLFIGAGIRGGKGSVEVWDLDGLAASADPTDAP